MILRRGAAAIAATLATFTSAWAQIAVTPAGPAADPDAVLVEELVVTARLPGPAWWRVSNGTSTVYVLGAPSLAPKHMDWDRSVFDRRLAGASRVILPFQNVRVTLPGVLGAASAYLRLRSSTPFEETLDGPDRARFEAARTRAGQPASRYKTKNPLAASLLLATDYREKFGLTVSDPTKLIKLLAQRAKVPITQRSYDLVPLMGAMLKTEPQAGRACLEEMVAQVIAGPGATLQAAKAWADGDVRGALANERTYERCFALVPGAQAFDTRVKADMAADIEKALKVPGHALAVEPLRPLLAQGGVLDQLRAKGYEVKTPGEE